MWTRLRQRLGAFWHKELQIPDALWHPVLASLEFLSGLSVQEQLTLRSLCQEFLRRKEFFGAQGLQVTDAMGLSIALQACVPLLHLAPDASARKSLQWYDDFVGIVVHPAQVIAKREALDEVGVVHAYHEVLAGEAMQGGPLMLNWHDVADANTQAHGGMNLVIHEFAHKLDMRKGAADGCPPLPPGFLATTDPAAARRAWFGILGEAHRAFREQCEMAQRFGGPTPWLDAYAADSVVEFFAVACEAYFVQRARFAQEFPQVLVLFDAFFRPAAPRAAR